jgi:hypothetical protein
MASRTTLVIALRPQLISAGMIPAGLLERTMVEPNAEGRDEVIYLICTHRRAALGGREFDDGWRNIYLASGGIGGPFTYDLSNTWGRVRFPGRVRPSRLGWAVLDPLIEEVEGITTDGSFDPDVDPDGDAGRHRHELLGWIYDRHLEHARERAVDRGEVQGGHMDFRLEYIGMAHQEALRRAAGPHHKVSLILHRTLVYSPDRLVCIIPCDINAAVYEAVDDETDDSVSLARLADAVIETGIPRRVVIAAAEEALIADLGAPHNERNARERRFPNSDAGDRLVSAGMQDLIVGFIGFPKRVAIHGVHATITHKSKASRIQLRS